MALNAGDPAASEASRAGTVLLGGEQSLYSSEPPKKQRRGSVPRVIVIRTSAGAYSVSVEPHPTIKRNAVGFNRRLPCLIAAREWGESLHALKGWELRDETGSVEAAPPVVRPLSELSEDERVVRDFARMMFREARRMRG